MSRDARRLPLQAAPHGYWLESACDRHRFERVIAPAGWRVAGTNWEELEAGLVRGGMLFASCAEGDVGTACLSRTGGSLELSWVFVRDDHRGRGLATALCTKLLSTTSQTVTLQTEDHRLPAIAMYRKLGFEPELRNDEQAARWAAVERRLQV